MVAFDPPSLALFRLRPREPVSLASLLKSKFWGKMVCNDMKEKVKMYLYLDTLRLYKTNLLKDRNIELRILRSTWQPVAQSHPSWQWDRVGSLNTDVFTRGTEQVTEVIKTIIGCNHRPNWQLPHFLKDVIVSDGDAILLLP